MKQIAILLSLLLVLGCTSTKETTAEKPTPIEYITIEDQIFEAFAGPNLVRISSNFYADQTEVTNSFYKEFMQWTKTTYGINSQEYIDILPSQNVWNFQDHIESMAEKYLWNAEFDDHPVVGINLEQAKKYANWRTERVVEMLLIEKGILNPTINNSRDNHFTIQRFLNGSYPLRNELKNKIIFPRYSVPTIEEWEQLSGISPTNSYGIDSLNRSNQEFIKRGNKAFHTFEDFENKVDKKVYKNTYNHVIKSAPTRPAQYGIQNVHGLYHTIGNVAEMVDSLGVAKGGDWMHTLEHASPTKNHMQNIPNCWTGFRCVGRLEILD